MGFIEIEDDIEKEVETLGHDVGETFDEIENVARLLQDVINISEDWKTTIHAISFVISEVPTIEEACQDIVSIGNTVVDTLSSGGLNIVADVHLLIDGAHTIKGESAAISEMFQKRAKLLHSVLIIERFVNNVGNIVKRGERLHSLYKDQPNSDPPKQNRMKKGARRLFGCWQISNGKDQKHKKPSKSTPPDRKAQATISRDLSTGSKNDRPITIDSEVKSELSKVESGIENAVEKSEEVAALVSTVGVLAVEWKPALQSLSQINGVIPEFESAIEEVKAIADLVKNSLEAAEGDPLSLPGLLSDGRQVFDDAKALFHIAVYLDKALEATLQVKDYVLKIIRIISRGEQLLSKHQSPSNKKKTLATMDKKDNLEKT